MRFDKRHLIGSAVLLAGSIAYNVWVFWGPAAGQVRGQSGPPDTFAGQTSPGSGGAPVIDPRQIPPPPAVDLTINPQWTRDPFRPAGNVTAVQPAGTPLVEGTAPAADPVVGAILFSSERRIAIVNGRTVGIGDRIDIGEIVDITRDAIFVRRADGQVRQLTLTPSKFVREFAK